MRITIIGGGNLGAAIASGAIKASVVKAKNVTISHLEPKCHQLFDGFLDKINIEDDNAKSIANSDFIIVAVKPWIMGVVLEEISSTIDRSRQAVVSIAAGIKFSELETMLNVADLGAVGLYRVSSNTAIAISQSVNVICKHNTSEDQDKELNSIFKSLGDSMMVKEEMLPALISLSSCGIAFAYKYVDAAIDGAVELGVDREVARDVVLQTIKGAIMMLESNNTPPQEEIDKVTTKGGITIKGLEAMESSGFSEAVKDGLRYSR